MDHRPPGERGIRRRVEADLHRVELQRLVPVHHHLHAQVLLRLLGRVQRRHELVAAGRRLADPRLAEGHVRDCRPADLALALIPHAPAPRVPRALQSAAGARRGWRRLLMVAVDLLAALVRHHACERDCARLRRGGLPLRRGRRGGGAAFPRRQRRRLVFAVDPHAELKDHVARRALLLPRDLVDPPLLLLDEQLVRGHHFESKPHDLGVHRVLVQLAPDGPCADRALHEVLRRLGARLAQHVPALDDPRRLDER
mmetsp:Transcript_5030/g.12383  ORF Transcript_5030/g.12383 Transcript_5030/m.12383 type:complete len:255 (+) Transcript_5030:1123-1887(+)